MLMSIEYVAIYINVRSYRVIISYFTELFTLDIAITMSKTVSDKTCSILQKILGNMVRDVTMWYTVP